MITIPGLMGMMNKLRVETRELHEEIEKDNLAGLIISNKIEMEEYKLLLLQNYIAYKITETEIAKHLHNFNTTKSEQLQQDLEALEVDYSLEGKYLEEFSCKNKAEAIGAAYVVEGSALGGMLISRQLKNCANLANIERHHFFNGNKDNLKSWKDFSKEIDTTTLSPEEEAKAVEMAKETFRFFGKVFREVRLPS